MSDKDPKPDDDALDEFDAIMQSVSSQLTEDIYDVSSRGMDDELDAIAGKLADDADFDLGDLDDGAGIDLLEGSQLPSFPDDSSGLSYEDPDDSYSRIADHRKEAPAIQPPPAMAPPEPSAKSDDEKFLDDEDPMLLLDEEINVDKQANNGGILTIVALVLALIGAAIAGTATWLTLGIKGQLSQLATQITTPAPQAPDPKLEELDAKLSEMTKQLHANEATLKDHGDRLALLVTEGTNGNELETKLAAFEKQLSGLSNKLGGTETSINQTRSQLEKQHEQLRTEFNTRINGLSTNPPPRQVTASTNPAAVKPEASTVVASTAPAQVKQHAPAQPESKSAPEAPAAASHPAKANGAWVVNLASYPSEQDAANILKKLQKHGIFPQKRRVEVKGQTWYRLYVDGFANQAAAQRYVKTVQQIPELHQAWAGRAD
jgi:cell division septation protein DedD